MKSMAQIKESTIKEGEKKSFEYKKIQQVESTLEGKKYMEAPKSITISKKKRKKKAIEYFFSE